MFAAGKLYPAKGFDALLKILTPKIPDDMELVIAGDGPEEERLRRTYESKSVKFLGWLSPPRYFNLSWKPTSLSCRPYARNPAQLLFEGLLLGKPTFRTGERRNPGACSIFKIP